MRGSKNIKRKENETMSNIATIKTEDKKLLGTCSIIFSLIIAITGIILGIIGICRYPKKSTGWWLSMIGLSLGALNFVIGLLLQFILY
jgi:ABC-type antimicrobial peptide transport system permease subunit